MRKITLKFQVSLDGVVSNADRWMYITDEVLEDSIEYYENLDAIIVGGNSYLPLAEYWQKAEQSSRSSLERNFARRINQISKLVLTHSEVDLVWNNSKLLLIKDSESFVQEIKRLKVTEGRDISVEAGKRTWQHFLEHDLWDGITMWVHPVIVGSGEPLFSAVPAKTALHLADSKIYRNGVIMLQYEK